MSLLAAEAISVRLGGAEVLRHVSLSVKPREIVTILGPNGSGKSTLLRALLGIVPVSQGRVLRAAGLRLGYVPQRLSVDPSLPITVRRFLSLPVRVTDAQATAALARTGVPEVAGRQMAALSGGQLQRVLLARALLSDPQVLVLDEPTQGLDQPGEAAFYRLIEEVRAATGAAVLMVSHDLHVVMAASDRVICLNGHICCEGTPQVVSGAPEYRALFGLGTRGALALYQHVHDHSHDGGNGHSHDADDHDAHGHGLSGHDAPSHDAPSHDAPSHDAPSHDAPSHDGRDHGPHDYRTHNHEAHGQAAHDHEADDNRAQDQTAHVETAHVHKAHDSARAAHTHPDHRHA